MSATRSLSPTLDDLRHILASLFNCFADSCLKMACPFGSEQSPQDIHRRGEGGRRDGERNKGVERLRRRVIADQMWEALPSLACKHTPLSR